MTKLHALSKNLSSAADFLEKAMNSPPSDIQRAATIQAFEFCFELSWKLLQEKLRDDGLDVSSPKAAFRAAVDNGYIESVEEWFEYLGARNLTSHTYNETVANQVYGIISDQFLTAVRVVSKVR